MRNQFSWVDDDEYASNRRKRLTLSRKERGAIKIAVEFLNQHKLDNLLDVSPVDILCLSHAHVLGIAVVTDDEGMLALARDFGIKALKTLELLKLMLDCGHISMKKIQEIVLYWDYTRDRPKDFKTDYRRLFGKPPPRT